MTTDTPPPATALPTAKLAAWRARWSPVLRRMRTTIAVVAAGGAILSGVLGYWNTYRALNGSTSAAESPRAAASTADAGPLSIAVLPFSTRAAGDAAQTELADGLTASVTADLSRIGEAFVVGAGTAMAFKDRPLRAQQIGRELGVRYVLQGQVQRSGQRIRIRAQLTDSATNAQLWSEDFDGDSDDLFALQDRVTTLIGNSMGRELVIRAAHEIEARRSSPTVTDLMLQARALQIRPLAAANWQRIEALCRQAIALDPGHPEATLLLAKALAIQSQRFGLELGPDALMAKIDEAVALGARIRQPPFTSDDARVNEVVGLAAQLRGDFDGALRAFRRRLELEPRSVEAHVELANAYLDQVDSATARQLLATALALDPRYPTDELIMGWLRAEFMLGHDDAAIEWGERGMAANPGWFVRLPTLAMAYAMKGERGKAAAAAAATFRSNPSQTVSAWVSRLDFPLTPVHPAYRDWALRNVVPAMRLAGFPE